MPRLSIDITAQLASFQSALDQVNASARQSASLLERSFAGVSSAISGVTSALAGLGVGLGVGGIVALAKSSVDAVAALDDLSERTTLSVEFLSRLQQTARIAGTDMEFLATGASRFARAVAGARAGSQEQAAVFRDLRIELDATKDKVRDIDDLFVEFARTVTSAEDHQTALAAATRLLGRSGEEYLPILSDIARDGLRAARVTADQAARAEEAQKAMRELGNAVDEARIALGIRLLPVLTEIGAAMRRAAEEGRGFFGILREGLATALTGSDLDKARSDFRKYGDELVRLNKLLDEAERLRGGRGAPTGRELVIQRQRDEVKARLNAVNEIILAEERLRRELSEAAETPRTKIGTGFLNNEGVARALREREELMRRHWASEEAAMIARFEEAESLAIAEGQRMLRLRREMDREEELLRREDIRGQVALAQEMDERNFREAHEEARARIQELEEQSRSTRDMARDLGMVFTSAFEDAALSGRKFGDVLKGLAQDLARLVLRRGVTEPLLKFAEGALGKIDWSRLLPGASVGMDFVPRDMPVFVHKGEAIIPASENARGRVNVTNIYHIDARADRAAIVAEIRASEQRTLAMVQDLSQRGAMAVG